MASTKKQQQQVAIINSYKKILGSEDGKVVLYDLMRRGNMMSSCFVIGDSHASAIKEGERNLVLYILSRLEFTEKELDLLINETNNFIKGALDD